jgi:hypothetical protein
MSRIPYLIEERERFLELRNLLVRELFLTSQPGARKDALQSCSVSATRNAYLPAFYRNVVLNNFQKLDVCIKTRGMPFGEEGLGGG